MDALLQSFLPADAPQCLIYAAMTARKPLRSQRGLSTNVSVTWLQLCCENCATLPSRNVNHEFYFLMNTRAQRLLIAWLMPLLLLTAQFAIAQHEIKHLSIASSHAGKQGKVPLERAACDQCFAFASLAGAMPVAALHVPHTPQAVLNYIFDADTLCILERVQTRNRDPPLLS